jgi:hypothetical protein
VKPPLPRFILGNAQKRDEDNEKIAFENENNRSHLIPTPSAIVSTLEMEAVIDVRLLISFKFIQ